MMWIVLLGCWFGCSDASTERQAIAASYTHRGPIAMCLGSERYPVESTVTVITGRYFRSNINNSCLEFGKVG